MAHAGLTKSAKKKAKASKSVGSLSFGHGIEPFSAKSGKPSNKQHCYQVSTKLRCMLVDRNSLSTM